MKNLMENLIKNNMEPYFVEKAEDVVPLVKTLIKEGETVSAGGSLTLKQTGITELLKSGKYNFLDRSKDGLTQEDIREIYIKTFGADTYFASANAITKNGEIYNVDGNANRVSAIIFGPKQVILVVGVNKIVDTLDDAIKRVKEISAPCNTKRLSCDTYCNKTGHCISLDNGGEKMTDGCESDGRICCSYTVLAHQRAKNRIKIILVNEELGFWYKKAIKKS